MKGVGSVVVRPHTSDAAMFRHTFIERQYDISAWPQGAALESEYHNLLNEKRTPLIIDCGANIGTASLWFARLFPDALVIAVEPNEENARICRQNTINKNVRTVHAAIGATRGSVELLAPNGDDSSWEWAAAGAHPQEAVGIECTFRTRRADGGTVPVTTIPDLIVSAGALASPFIVKIDIEGFEDDLFSANVEWIHHARAIFIEPHDNMLPGAGSSRNFQRAMSDAGFELLISGENLVYFQPLMKACDPGTQTIAPVEGVGSIGFGGPESAVRGWRGGSR